VNPLKSELFAGRVTVGLGPLLLAELGRSEQAITAEALGVLAAAFDRVHGHWFFAPDDYIVMRLTC
jgi:hypothetical protein